MRQTQSTILELHFFIIHLAAVKSTDKKAFLLSLATSEEYFKKWCDAVDHTHATPMSYDILKNLTEEDVKKNYHADSSYPIPKKLSEIHRVLYKTKTIRECLKTLDYLNHHEFYKAISNIKVEERYLTHADLIENDEASLKEMVGEDVYNAPVKNAMEDPEEEPSRLNFPLIREFIQHFKFFEQRISEASLASYLHVKPETLKKHLQLYKDNADKSLDFDTLITCDLENIETQFILTKKSKKKKTAEPIAQAEPANKSSAQKRKAPDADANVYAPKTGHWTQSVLLQTSFNPQPMCIAIPQQTPPELNDYPGTFFMHQAPINLPHIGFAYAHSTDPAYPQPTYPFFSQPIHNPMHVQGTEKDYFTEPTNALL